MTTSTNTNHNDEIDLLDVFRLLWAKKWWIILTTLVCTALAAAYAFTAKEQWTSKAEILKPTLVDIKDYYSLQEQYALASGGEVKLDDVINHVFTAFTDLAFSKDEQAKAISQSHYFADLVKSQNADKTQSAVLLNNLVTKGFKLSRPDPKLNKTPSQLSTSFSAETAQAAQETLTKVITDVNAQSEILLRTILTANIEQKIQSLDYQIETIKQQQSSADAIQLANLEKAFSIAKNAGIEDYSKGFNLSSNGTLSLALSDSKDPLKGPKLSDGSYLFMLGSKYLQAQIDVLKQKNVIYPPRYYTLVEQANTLKKLLPQAEQVKLQTYRYLSSPDYPTEKDKPKKALILIIGAFIGVILGALIVIISNFFKRGHK